MPVLPAPRAADGAAVPVQEEGDAGDEGRQHDGDDDADLDVRVARRVSRELPSEEGWP